jgi:small GTP-binding protein
MTYSFRYILLGDTGVGKSSVLLRLTDNRFDSFAGNGTVGIDYGLRSIQVENQKVRIQIWDIAGQERFMPIALAYLDNVSVIVFMYDISARHTFESIKNYWLPHVRSQNLSRHKKMILVGNKSDKFDERQVPAEEAIAFASKERMWFYEVSAYDGSLITNIFTDVSRDVILDIHDNIIDPSEFGSMGISMDLHLNISPQIATETHDNRNCWCVLM